MLVEVESKSGGWVSGGFVNGSGWVDNRGGEWIEMVDNGGGGWIEMVEGRWRTTRRASLPE